MCLLLFNWMVAKDLSRYLDMAQVQGGVLQCVEQRMPLRKRIGTLPE